MRWKPVILGVAIALILQVIGQYAHAESLGGYGRTYPIRERDAIDAMKDAARKKMANGGKEAMIKGAQDRYLASLNNVVTPPGIRAATVNATRLVDLSVVAGETIKAPNGSTVVAAGTRINPLTIKPLTKKVFFIDARDQRQIQLVRDRAAPEDKVILLGGSVFKASEALQRHVFLDVPGLHKRMQIFALPSVASQEGDKLKVEEVAK